MKAVLACLLVLVALAASQVTTIDDFTLTQRILVANDKTLSDEVSVSDPELLGGERDTGLAVGSSSVATCTAPLASTVNISPTGTLGDDTGIFIAANDQSCFSRSVVQYDGADGSIARSFTPGLGAFSNFNDYASAFHVRYFSDLKDGVINVLALTSATNICTTQLRTSGGNVPDDKVINFSVFTGTCDFNNIRILEVEVPAQINFDVTFSLFELLTTAASGRVYVDCTCNDSFDAGTDQVLSGIVVTLTPANGCQSSQPRTTTTDSNGQYRFSGLPACTFTVSSAVSSFTACSSSSKSITTTFGTEATANFPYRAVNNFEVPDDVTVTCVQSTDASNTGTATSGGTCTGAKPVTSTDTITNGKCDGAYVITRKWTDGTQSGTQIITVTDTKIGPSISCPSNFQATCAQSLKPAITGRPTVSDDCTTDIDVTYTGTDVKGTCDGGSCSRDTIVTRKFVARDDCGNIGDDCTQIITITPCATATTCPSPANCHNSSILYRGNVITDL